MYALSDPAARGPPVKPVPFQREFLRGVADPEVDLAALCCPRGAGKTLLGAHLGALCLRPGSALFRERVETVVVAGSIEQARILLHYVRESLDRVASHYRWSSGTRPKVVHKGSGTILRILSSSAKRALGLSRFRYIIGDEPGAWEAREGEAMYQGLRTSLGKLPGQKLILLGTRAPAEPGSWWPDLVDGGSGDGIHVTDLRAPDDAPWDHYHTALRANPVIRIHPSLRRRVLRERDEARRNPTMRPVYEAFRLNKPVSVTADALVEVDDWRAVEAREVPPRVGRPVVGLDLGGDRSWSAAACLYLNGRLEVYALTPGIPDLKAREKQDGQPRGMYERLVGDGSLVVDRGVRFARPHILIDHLLHVGIRPAWVICDRFAWGALADAVGGRWPVVKRVGRWSEATEDIAGFRQLTADGPLAITPESRRLARLGISEAVVEEDTSGNSRLRKRRGHRSRDDVAMAGILAAGALVREIARRGRGPTWRSVAVP